MRQQTVKAFTLISAVFWLDDALAFKPGRGDGHTGVTCAGLGEVRRPDARSDEGGPHLAETVGCGHVMTGPFPRSAAQQIIDYTNDVDSMLQDEREFWEPVAHCDDEQLGACSKHIHNLTEQTIQAFCQSFSDNAQDIGWKYLGRALHALQDFYAHSNFVNLAYHNNPSEFDYASPKIEPGLLDGVLTNAAKGARVCQADRHSYLADAPLTSGHFPGSGRLVAGTVLGEFSFEGSLTAWLGDVILTGSELSKCDHGVDPLDDELTPGISKDRSPDEGDAKREAEHQHEHEHTRWHSKVTRMASFHSTVLIERVAAGIQARQALPKDDPQSCNADALDLLFASDVCTLTSGYCSGTPGGVRTVGIVVDTTKSMGAMIEQVEMGLASAIDQAGNLATKFTVVSFGDPSLPIVEADLDATEARDAVSKLEAGVPDDGGECAEPVLNALSKAIEALPHGASLLLFTDAPAKDHKLEASVLQAMADKQIALSVNFLSSTCVDSDVANAQHMKGAVRALGKENPGREIYERLALRSGGQLLEQARDAADLGAFVSEIVLRPTLPSDQTVLSVSGKLAAAKETFSFPVDSTLLDLVVSTNVGAGASDITLTGPDKSVLAPAATGANGRIFSIAKPKVGAWHLSVTASKGAPYSVVVRGQTPLVLEAAKFLVERGRPGHEGLFPDRGNPMAHHKQPLRIDVSGEYGSMELSLVDAAGQSLAKLDVKEDEALKQRFVALAEPPAKPFRVQIAGKSKGGEAFQRVSRRAIDSSEVSISPGINPAELVPGQVFRARFLAKNRGPKHAYVFSVNTSLGSVRNVTPASAILDTDESVEVLAEVQVPGDATARDAGPEGLVTITGSASRDDVDAPRTNSSFIRRRLQVDSDGDGVPDEVEQGAVGGDVSFDGNDDGAPDREQANVVSTPSRSKNGYLTFALGTRATFENFQARFAPGVTPETASTYPLDAFSFRIRSSDAVTDLEAHLHTAPPHDYAGYYRYGDITGAADPGWEALTTEVRDDSITTLMTKVEDGAIVDHDGLVNGKVDVTLAIGRISGVTDHPASTSEGGCHLALPTPFARSHASALLAVGFCALALGRRRPCGAKSA